MSFPMAKEQFEFEAQEAAKIALLAGEKLRTGFTKDIRISHKGSTDLVTEMDIASEHLIKKSLAQVFPQDNYLGEELGGCSFDKGRVWVVDPLDGTTNYAHGLGIFAVSIALCIDGNPKAGVVYQPITNEIFMGWENGGAYRNNVKISVSKRATLKESLAVTGFPYSIEDCLDSTLKRLRRMMIETRGIRRLGSAAMDLCYVAGGIFDLFWETGLKPWDIAAGIVILREAGGKTTDFSGNPIILDCGELLSTNHILHADALKLVAQQPHIAGKVKR